MEILEIKLIVKDSQARHLSNPKVATVHHPRTEWPFCKHGANGFTNLIWQGPSGPGIVKRSVLLG
jgi:hypothetical protein